MVKRILVANMGAHGHVNPTLAVVEELVRRGFEVIYFSTEALGPAIRATGARFESYDSPFSRLPLKRADGTFDLTDLPAKLLEELIHVLPQLEPRFEALKPDLVLYDSMCHGGRLAARRLGIRRARSCPVLPSNDRWSVMKALGREPPGGRAEMAKALFGRYGERLRALGLGDLPPGELFSMEAPLNLVFLPREFHPAAEAFGDSYVFVGPCLRSSPPFDPGLAPGEKLLFISLGTVFNDWPGFLELCFEAFGDSQWKVVMATGREVSPAAVPTNFRLMAHAPQLPLLERADAFLTHGGMNSLMESTVHGVPFVVIPQMAEQEVNGRRAVELGMGELLLPAEVTAASLREAVARVSESPDYRRRVREWGERCRRAGGVGRAVEALTSYLESP